MNHTSSNSNPEIYGWTSGPNKRGTIDIIWSSFLTIGLCTWTAICLNLPHPNDGAFQILLRRAKWMFWALLGPEVVLTVAIGQLASARRSVHRLNKLAGKRQKWTLRHGFYTDMGGMLLRPKDSTPFLVNSRQLAYLVEKQYLPYPEITAQEIWDRSKTDSLARILTVLQVGWFIVQLLGRAILSLSTTTLELSTGAIVVCTIGTFFCWFHKPSDVQTSIVLRTEVSTAQILIDAGDAAAAPYKNTPLDFVAKESPTCGYDVMKFFHLRFDDRERPLRRFPNDRFPDIGTFEKFALFCFTTMFASLHLIGWDFNFPSRVECYLWRISSTIVAGGTVSFWVLETIAARQRFGRWDKYLIWLRLKKPNDNSSSVTERTLPRLNTVDRLDAFEKEQKQAKPILLWEVMLISSIAILYITARAYMIVEMFVGLRTLPAEAYQTFDLVDILPHW